MELRRTIIIILSIFIVGCSNRIVTINHSNKSIRDNPNQPDSILADQSYFGLTLEPQETWMTKYLEDSVFYKFIMIDKTFYKIQWGNKYFINTTKELRVMGSGAVRFLEKDDNSMIFTQGCGQTCVLYLILPLNKNAVEAEYSSGINYDLRNKLVAYSPEYPIFVRIENFESKKYIDFVEINRSSVDLSCIDSSFFKNNQFLIFWQGKNYRYPMPDPQFKAIAVDSLINNN